VSISVENLPPVSAQKFPHDLVGYSVFKPDFRYLVENAFARIKYFLAIATRYDKLERNYSSMVALTFMIMWLMM